MRRFMRLFLAFVTCVGILGLLAAKPKADGKKTEIDGQWVVVSVELGGQEVPGLAGAELTLDKGKKTFKLPSGTEEEGTYSLDEAADPKEIDSTTDGRGGTELGIYKLEGGELTMCLAPGGGARPKSFASKAGTLVLVLKRSDSKPEAAGEPADEPEESASNEKPTGTRSFRMGFTGFCYDITPEAVAASRKFCRENGDILAHHIEGVPWAEALSGEPFPKAVLQEWENKKAAAPPNGKVYLAISPGRGELKVQDKAGPVPSELAGKDYNDPLVQKAYLNYCRRAIEFFQPDYLAIGIEVNEIYRDPGPEKWNSYVALHQHTYRELKKEHPALPIFASWTLHQMFQARGGMLKAFKEFMPYNDVVAVSYYPFFVPDKDRLSALDWMTEQFDEFDKPYAMVETNDEAERLPLPSAKVVIQGTPAKQAAYYRKLLATAQKRDFLFVISFVHQDYDALWEKIKAGAPELFMAWRDCGLLDENGKARPAYAVWKSYFELPLK